VRRRKKGQATSPLIRAAHDRRAREIGALADVAPVEVDDPYAIQPGEKIVVLRQLRGDPLARLHAHRQIDEAQYLAGRVYQRDWEAAERGARAIDPTREMVDNSRALEPMSERQVRARARLLQVRTALGRKMHAVAHAVLIDGATFQRIAHAHDRKGESWQKYYGRLFRDALDGLAVEYDLAGKPK
jgi:hypothetical protein